MLNHLGLFAKYWEPGKVKTRLAAGIGPQAACRVYRCFLEHLVHGFAQFADVRTIGFSPDDKNDEFQKLAGSDWNLIPQSPGDLGIRMHRFFEAAFKVNKNLTIEAATEPTRSKVILIGSDTPHLPLTLVESAFEILDRNQVVLGPCTDGGFGF